MSEIDEELAEFEKFVTPEFLKYLNRPECCDNCINLQTRIEELTLEVGEKVEEEEEEEVKLHSWKIQVVITTNTPPGFKLSLDYLPCFQQKQVHLGDFRGPVREDVKHGWIIASCGGILLCTNAKFNQNLYYLCNPLSKQWLALPPTPRTHVCTQVGFVYDPCPAAIASGSIDHPLTCPSCRFMVVRFPPPEFGSVPIGVECYLSEAAVWRTEPVTVPTGLLWDQCHAKIKSILHMGCLHWLSDEGDIVVYDPYKYAFNGLIKQPEQDQTCTRCCFSGFSLCKGFLWLAQYSRFSQQFRFWKLNGYTSADKLDECYWSLQRHFRFHQLPIEPKWTPTSMLSFHPYDDEVAYLELHRGVKGFVVSFNLRTGTLGPPMCMKKMTRRWADVFTLDLPRLMGDPISS